MLIVIPRPPYLGIDSFDLVLGQQLQQAVRRKLSTSPSPSDLKLLSTFLEKLFDHAISNASEPLPPTVLVSRPLFLSLSNSDLDSAFNSTGLENLKYTHTPSPARQPLAGFVLTPAAASAYEDDISALNNQILSLTYTKEVFCIDILYTKTSAIEGPYSFYEPWAECYKFGYNYAGQNIFLFDNIRGRIVNAGLGFLEFGHGGKETWGAKGIDRVVLNGESAGEVLFINTVYAALEEMGIWKLYEGMGIDLESGFDGTFVAARGAAELASRWQPMLVRCRKEKESEMEQGPIGAVGVE